MEALFWIVATTIVAIILIVNHRTKTNSAIVMAIFKSMLNENPRYYYEKRKTGIAISNNFQKIALVNENRHKVYNLEDIRNHETSIVEPDQIIGNRIGMQAHAYNVGSAIKASRESGLFIKVKDIEYPVWRIEMFSKVDQQRWHELLNQLYEGRLKISDDHANDFSLS